MPRKQKKYHFIYQTKNLLNNKFYIGMHSTNDLEDGYVGSGKRLWYSINKHGIENHAFEILEFLPSREELKKREAEIINEELLNNPLCMNLKFGGEGGWDHVKASRANLESPKMKEYLHSEENNAKLALGRTSESSSKARRTLWQTKRELMLEISRVNVANTLSDEAKAKRKETFAKNKHQSGESNSQFGTCWIHKEDSVKKIKKEDLQVWIDLGWSKGRK